MTQMFGYHSSDTKTEPRFVQCDKTTVSFQTFLNYIKVPFKWPPQGRDQWPHNHFDKISL